MMAARPLLVGQGHANLLAFEKNKPIEKSVVTQEVLKLFRENEKLDTTSFEHLRAKSFSIILGGMLPVVITGLFVVIVFYGLFRAPVAMYHNIQKGVSAFALKVFATITASSASVAIATGVAFTAALALSRPVIYGTIDAFFGSLCESINGTILASLIQETQNSGYEWWYGKYHFEEREKKIQSNFATIIAQLTNTYNDMASELLLCHDFSTAQRKAMNASLSKKIPMIHTILRKRGLRQNQCKEMTLQLEKAIRKLCE